MKNTRLLLLLPVLILFAGCASNQAFNAKQLNLIKQHKIVVSALPENNQPLLKIYSRSDKVGSEAAGVVFGLLTGSFGYRTQGNTPRTRFDSQSPLELMKHSTQKAAAEQVEVAEPTHAIYQMLAKVYETGLADSPANENELTITIKPVAWHLHYDKLFENQPTYLLEYAGDITLSLPAQKLSRYFPCDKQSSKALSKAEWFANDALRIRGFVNELADSCVKQIVTELGQ